MKTGREPVQNFIIETISDPLDPRLNKFREVIYREDLGVDSSLIREVQSHKWWKQKLSEKVSEDAYKYCDAKWNSVQFDNIEAIIEDGEVVGMSGCKKYGNFLRTSMHLYLLKRVRAKYAGIKYLDNGWFSRHISYAKSKNCDGMFFTVYAYSKKLQGLIKNHQKRTISLVDKSHLRYMEDIVEKGEYLFNGVPQTFFYYPLIKQVEEFDPNEFI